MTIKNYIKSNLLQYTKQAWNYFVKREDVEEAIDKNDIIGKLGEDQSGNLTYDGDPIAGVSDYSDMSNKPSINNIILSGNKTAAELGLATSQTVQDQIAAVVANAPQDFDTLKEISDWIGDHADDASAMNTAIQSNTSAISSIQTAIQNGDFDGEDGEDGITFTPVITQLQNQNGYRLSWTNNGNATNPEAVDIITPEATIAGLAITQQEMHTICEQAKTDYMATIHPVSETDDGSEESNDPNSNGDPNSNDQNNNEPEQNDNTGGGE